MNIFNWGKKPIVVDCYTYNKTAFELYPIDTANKFIPRWWLHAPKELIINGIPTPTLKRCAGLMSQYKHGLVIPLWSEMIFTVTNEAYTWRFSDGVSNMQAHFADQWRYYADPAQIGALKIETPWIMKTSEDIDWVFMKPSWNYKADNQMNILSGVVNCKAYQSTNINFTFPYHAEYSVRLEAGQALVQMIPISDRPIKIRHHLVSKEEYDNLLHKRFAFTNFQNKLIRLIRRKE